jgi:site-specific DNA recombinase
MTGENVVNPPAPSLAARVGPSTGPTLPGAGAGGLSDLAVSPFGLPVALLRGEVRVAFVGRTSTEDQQDPRQSLLRQLERSRTALPAAWVIVCHFYDVESGRLELADRGHGVGIEERFDIPIPRDGGLADLLAEAAHPNRRFDVVICETMSRLARRMYENLSVERELERAGVPVFAWNEPIKLDGGRAQQILQRRINQSVAEYEVFNSLEMSWGGLCTHVREGYNIGKPPYGYKAKTYRHPNPAKAARRQSKTRLEPDGARGETVTQIALWRYHEQLGYDSIAERLNADLEKYPPPEPPGGLRARGAWGKSSVCDLLRNPKYTGYQVFNRRASRSKHGKVNDPALWVWSPEPHHTPLIPKWMFDEMTARRAANRGSRPGGTTNTHPATTRTYLFRGMIHCGCRRRLNGTQRRKHTITYYQCWPRSNNRGRPDKLTGHPKTVYINETAVLAAVSTFYAERVFGRQRRELMADALAGLDDHTARQRETDRDRLTRALADLERRQANILRQAQDADPSDPFTAGLRQTYNQLDTQRRDTLNKISDLDKATAADPARRPAAADTALLDALPYLTVNLGSAPQAVQRRLYELTQLTIRLHPDTQEASIMIKLPADKLPTVAAAASQAANGGGSVDAVRAPNVSQYEPRSSGRRA